jgi:Tfp pilus assembly protein PilN
VIAKLNLASQPFRNRTLPWAVAAVVALVSLVALVYTLAEHRRVRAEAETAERQVETLRREHGQLKAQAEEIRQNIPPEQQQALRAAHALVEDRSFSWSQLFSDLEEALPAGVRVSRINVREVKRYGDQTRADLDLTVVGRAASDVINMIADMRRAGTFAADPLTSNQKSGKGEAGYEWVLRVSYVQRARRVEGEERGPGEVGAGGAPSADDYRAAAGGATRRE